MTGVGNLLSRLFPLGLVALGLYFALSKNYLPSIMASAESPSSFPLRVSIAATREAVNAGQPCELDVTIHNDDADTPITVLTWNTPLDESPVILGVFEIHDRETGDLLPIDVIQFMRQLPPLPEHLVEIQPKGTVTAHVSLKDANLSPGHTYTIQAKGWWQSVWRMPKEEVVSKYLEDQSGAISGDFLSNTVEVKQVSLPHCHFHKHI